MSRRRQSRVLRMAGSGLISIACLVTAIEAGAATTLPTQSWNGYRWSRTGVLSIGLGDNVGSVWDPYLSTAIAEWSKATNIDFRKTAGRTTPAKCGAIYGSVQACNYNYGANGWLGWTTVWTSGGFVVQATVKLNDYYFGQTKYNTDAWRKMTMCHEIGHTLGLDHADSNKGNLNLGTCMDYTNDPSGKLGSANGKLANVSPGKSDFAALDGIYAKGNGTQLASTRPQSVVGAGLMIDGDFHEEVVAFVPEPATWAMLITGFGAVGASMRRRRYAAA